MLITFDNIQKKPTELPCRLSMVSCVKFVFYKLFFAPQFQYLLLLGCGHRHILVELHRVVGST